MRKLRKHYLTMKQKAGLVILSMGVAVNSQAVTCTGTDGLTACEMAQAISFTDILMAVAILVAGLVVVGVSIMGGRFLINWAQGRRAGV